MRTLEAATMTNDAATIAKKLAVNGEDLREPASAEEVKQFEQDMSLTLDPCFRKLYLQFNGFMSPSGDNDIELWSLERIRQERGYAIERGRERYFAIGDFMIDSDFLMCCLTREAAPIFYLHTNEELAPTASKFFD